MSAIINLEYNRSLNMWENDKTLQEIRRIVCSTPLSDIEFSSLVGIGKATGLSPYLREIWALKYKKRNKDTGVMEEQPAQIFIGRDGYRKGAQRHPDYEYHQVNAVYSKDEYRVINDEVQHNFGFSNRGELLGAYCIVKRKSSSRPCYVMVTMSEYYQKQSLWLTKPETMIKKVAEAQALRQAFQETFAGTYSDAELPQEPSNNNVRQLASSPGSTQTERLKHLLRNDSHSEMDDTFHENIQMRLLSSLIDETQLSDERLDGALEHYSVQALEDLTSDQRQDFIRNLKKIKQQQQGTTND